MANNTKIKSATKLIQCCDEILGDYIAERWKFVADIICTAEKSYHLESASGNWNVRLNAHGQTVPVVSLQNEFFMSLSFSFKPNGQKLDFKGISLQFYDVRKLLFRAEWDNWEIKKEESNEDEDMKQHPQPHWHLGDSKGVGVTERVAPTFQAYIQNSNYKQFEEQIREREKRDLSRLHFFMRMDEDKAQPICYDLTIETDFKQWLKEIMRSVNQELSYLSK